MKLRDDVHGVIGVHLLEHVGCLGAAELADEARGVVDVELGQQLRERFVAQAGEQGG